MKALALRLIRLATPRADREWVVGDTLEEFDRIAETRGQRTAERWLRREMWRVLFHAFLHPRAVRAAAGRLRLRDEFIHGLGQDVRYALRLLRRSPGFAAVAIATLAVGIGANTAVFAVVNGVLLKPLPFANAERLMLVHLQVPERDATGVYFDSVWSYPKYRTFLELQHVFDEISLFSVGGEYTIAGDAEPERVRGEVITDRYPSVLGITPVVGRIFTYDESNRAGATPVVMLGHGLWTRRYGSDPAIVGRTIQIDGTPHEVVGVLPRGFTGLNGFADLWLSLAAREPRQLTEAQSHSYRLVARRRSTVPEESVNAAVRTYGAEVSRVHDGPGRSAASARAVSLSRSRADRDVRLASLVLLGSVAFVLLIGCVNLTNLLLAKAIARRREVAIRIAIGAGRARIVRQFFVDGAVLGSVGALSGLGVAMVILRLAAVLLPDSEVFFRTSMAPGVPRLEGAAGLTRIGASMIGFDSRTFASVVALTIVTSILMALVPALQASSLRPYIALRTGGADTSRGLHRFGARSALVAVQIALALVLLTGAGLMVKSAAQLQNTSLGFDSDDVLTVGVALPREAYVAERGLAFFAELESRVRAIQGVDAVAFANSAPLSGGVNSTGIGLGGRYTGDGKGGRLPLIDVVWASPEYFKTLGIRLTRGRLFTSRDRVGQPKVVLINEAAAKALWPNADPIGTRVTVGMGGFHDGAEIIGVVSDVRYRTIETAAIPNVYIPLLQSYQPVQLMFVKSEVETRALVTAVSREVRTLDSNVPVTRIKTMDERVGDAMWRTRVGAWLLSSFAVLALLLTAIGIFGVMAHAVTQRTAEIGIRMALGAERRDVLGLVLGRAAVLAVVGLVAGLGSALALTRVIGTLLYGVEPHDPATFAAVIVLLGVVSLAACYVPARRATRVDAVVALRGE